MTPAQEPVSLVDDHGDVSVFLSVTDAAPWIEPIDVKNREYSAYDGSGRLLELSTDGRLVRVSLAEQTPTHGDQLLTILRCFLRAIGDTVADDPSYALPQIVSHSAGHAEQPRRSFSGWLDRWLEPRWRALLTWAVIAALTVFVFEIDGRSQWIEGAISFFLSHVDTSLGTSFLSALGGFEATPTYLFLLYWFPPLLLRLGTARTALWIVASMCLGIVDIVLWLTHPRPMDLSPWLPLAVLYGHLLGFPGLATLGRRTRVYITFPDSLLATATAFALLRFYPFAYAPAVASIAYGAIMLYGTAPLPRATERQLDEEQR